MAKLASLRPETRALLDKIKQASLSTDHKILYVGLCQVQVCSTKSEDEALAWVKDFCPSGTSGNWSKQNEQGFEPTTCDQDKSKVHYMFTC